MSEQAQRDVTHDTSSDLGNRTKQLATNGINRATRKFQQKAKEGMKKLVSQGTKKAIKLATKIIAKILMILAKILMALLPYLIAALVIWTIFTFISGWFVDEEYEQKAKSDNYQTESAAEDNTVTLNPDTGGYEIVSRSNGNKLYKMFYGYMAQKGYWKVVVDENGNPKGSLMRGDTKEAQKIMDRYNREKLFILNSDLLYLLDIELNAGSGNKFFFPEQFTQPVYTDKKFNLKDLTDEKGDLVVKSTKYDENGKPTNEKVEGVWDYGFGSIIQYREFTEEREKRGTLSETHEWDFEEHKLKAVKVENSNDKITENVDGYPRQTYMISKVTNAIGTISNQIKVEWKKTNEPFTKTVKIKIPGEKQVEDWELIHIKNSDGEPLYYEFDPLLTPFEDNHLIKEETPWPYTKWEKVKKWVPTMIETTKTYKGFVWEKIPQYDGEPNTDGIVGDKYFFDYLTNYQAYIPDVVMENFNIQERTGRDIEGLKEVFAQQEAVENAESEYDAAPTDSVIIDLSDNITGDKTNYQNAMKYIELFQIYGKRYGVDPYLLVAKAAQESGGRHEAHKNPNAGYGLMQIEAPGRVITSASALNIETGEMEKMIIRGPEDVDSVEDNIRAGAMIFASRVKQYKYNMAVAIQAYNYGPGGMGAVLDLYASSIGKTRDEVLANPSDMGWTAYRQEVHLNPQKYFRWSGDTYGDPEYLEHVLRYYSNPNGGTPYAIDGEGVKHAMDGTIQVGAAIIGNGTNSNQNWFVSLVEAVGKHWSELFEDSPTDALMNKDKYKWRKYSSKMSETEYDTFIKLYWSFMEDIHYSEVKDKITLEDWKNKYKALFENPKPAGTITQETIEAYESIGKLFPDGYGLPAEKISKIAKEYDGTMIHLAIKDGIDILAMAKGEISYANVTDGVVEITHTGGVKTRYTGLREVKVKVGNQVKQGDLIGKSNRDVGIGITDKEGNSVDPTPIFLIMGDGSQQYNYEKVLFLIESVKGYPYKLAGDANDKSRGYFDCSGLIQWAFREVGVNLPRTAQEQYNYLQKIDRVQAKPGDLVFFQYTYDAGRPITHVGLYIGNNQFWNANNNGVQIDTITGYWAEHNPVFARYVK